MADSKPWIGCECHPSAPTSQWRHDLRHAVQLLKWIWYGFFFVAMVGCAYGLFSGQMTGPAVMDDYYAARFDRYNRTGVRVEEVAEIVDHREQDIEALITRLLDDRMAQQVGAAPARLVRQREEPGFRE